MKKIFLFFDYHITALGVQEETLNKIWNMLVFFLYESHHQQEIMHSLTCRQMGVFWAW
jgi:hypothetical protein